MATAVASPDIALSAAIAAICLAVSSRLANPRFELTVPVRALSIRNTKRRPSTVRSKKGRWALTETGSWIASGIIRANIQIGSSAVVLKLTQGSILGGITAGTDTRVSITISIETIEFNRTK